MKLIKLLMLCSIIVCSLSFKEKKVRPNSSNKYCKMLDSLELERYTWKSGNYYANKILPKIIKESKIDATCEKGTMGYSYKSDSLFNSDIQKWRKYFNCK